jgi:DNA-directed RNA polymerase specialized sigma24 family protein
VSVRRALPRSEAQKRTLRNSDPDWALAEHIGIARRTLAQIAPPGTEVRLTAYLWTTLWTKRAIADLMGVSESTVTTRLRQWRRLVEAGGADAS